MFLQNINETTNRACPILFEDKKDCCGCSACAAVCPVKALRMVVDEEGFYYPEICMDICVKCYQCVKVCPLKNEWV